MEIDDLKILAASGESMTLEFKKSTALIRSAFEAICAFLNNKGGTVFFGVKNDGQLIGQGVTDNTRQEIANEIGKIEPTAKIEVDYILIDHDKYVIAVKVSAGEYAPYTYDGRAFHKVESGLSRMSQHQYEHLLVQRGHLNHSWEDFIAENYSIKDLDDDEIYKAIMDGIAEKRIPASIAKEGVEKILRQLALITEDGKIKRAAVVLFAKEIKSPYTNCWLKMARFSGIDKGGDFIDNQQVYCNAFRMLEVADSFLHKHLPMASYFKKDQFKRIDKFALPVQAVREALVNAICHRDYADHSGYVSIAIFDDRVEIWSNGTLPSKLKLEDLKHKHDSVLRNKLIAKIFYLRGYIEAWGTGIKKIIDSCRDHGIAIPKFSERTGGLVVIFKLADFISGSKIAKNLTARQDEILKLIKNTPLNAAQLFEKLKDAPSIRTIQKDLTQLEARNFVKREGKARTVVWVMVKDKP